MNLLRVLIADDHPRFRGRLRTLLGGAPGMAVSDEATSGEAAIASADRPGPE